MPEGPKKSPDVNGSEKIRAVGEMVDILRNDEQLRDEVTKLLLEAGGKIASVQRLQNELVGLMTMLSEDSNKPNKGCIVPSETKDIKSISLDSSEEYKDAQLKMKPVEELFKRTDPINNLSAEEVIKNLEILTRAASSLGVVVSKLRTGEFRTSKEQVLHIEDQYTQVQSARSALMRVLILSGANVDVVKKQDVAKPQENKKDVPAEKKKSKKKSPPDYIEPVKDRLPKKTVTLFELIEEEFNSELKIPSLKKIKKAKKKNNIAGLRGDWNINMMSLQNQIRDFLPKAQQGIDDATRKKDTEVVYALKSMYTMAIKIRTAIGVRNEDFLRMLAKEDGE